MSRVYKNLLFYILMFTVLAISTFKAGFGFPLYYSVKY